MESSEPLLPLNTTLSEDGDPVKLFLCWVRQSCDDCISMSNDVDCSWCPYVCGYYFSFIFLFIFISVQIIMPKKNMYISYSHVELVSLTRHKSSTCVPNPSPKYPLLAPINHPDVCPMGTKERWELRARGLGCNVSTRNFLSVSIAVLSSFVLMGLVALLISCLKAMIRSCSHGRSRREGRYLGVVLFRGWDGRSGEHEDQYERQQIRREANRDGVVDERSSLLGV